MEDLFFVTSQVIKLDDLFTQDHIYEYQARASSF